MKLSILDQTHPEYDADEIRVHRALYAGGKQVRALVEKLLLKGADEPAKRYEARAARAYYINHCAGIVDQLVSWLFSADASVKSEPEKAGDDAFWKDFQGDCDLKQHSLHQFQALCFREAFITGRAWTLVELPEAQKDDAGKPVTFETLADEDKAGARRAYLVALPTESVIDWEHDEDGELLWATVKKVRTPREDPTKARGLKVFSWTVYTRAGWTKYTWAQKKQPEETWTKDTEADSEEKGTHSFERVPIEELVLPDGFYILGKTRDHLVESYNARCAKSWGMYTGLFAMPVHKKTQTLDGSDTSIGTARVGFGYGIEIGEKEDLYLLEPTGASFGVAETHIAELKDELYRVVHQMALSADNSAGAMKRSGDSKSEDKESSEIVLKALSEIEAPSRERKLNMVALGRGEEIEWDVGPVENFTLQSSEEALNEGILAGAAGVRSPTFEKERQKKIVRAVLPDLKEELAKQIEDEIEEAIDADPNGGIPEVTGGLGPAAGDQGSAGAPAGGAGRGSAGKKAAAQRKMNGYGGGTPQRRPASTERTPG